jgi:hypothetical protein
MSGRFQGVCRAGLLFALLATMGACQSHPPRAAAPEGAPPKAHEPQDASYDWHVLLVAPLGSVLKEVPLTLHEVLLFRDEEHGSAATDDAAAGAPECYAADTPAPRFIAHTPDEYLLCFKQDRLTRIQASVRLPAAQAADVFAAACTLWLKNAAAADTQSSAAPTGAACEGRDGATRFSARLAEESGAAAAPSAAGAPGAGGAAAAGGATGAPETTGPASQPESDLPPADMVLSITLDGTPGP